METNPFRAQRLREESGVGPTKASAGRGSSSSLPSSPAASGKPGMYTRAQSWVGQRVQGQRWWIRAPLLLILAWIGRGYFEDVMASSIFSGVNLGFHEAGHAAFMWFGNQILTTAGGTIFEIGIPIVAGLYLLWKQRDPFGASVCVFWLGTALIGAGVYAADARAQDLPLVSPFGPIDVLSHDWTVMLMKFGRLSRDEEIGGFLQMAGKVAMVASLILGAWVLRIMAVKHAPADTAPAQVAAVPPPRDEGDRLRKYLDQ